MTHTNAEYSKLQEQMLYIPEVKATSKIIHSVVHVSFLNDYIFPFFHYLVELNYCERFVLQYLRER